MPLDAICLRAVVHELSDSSIGGRVEKVYQPDKDEIILALRSPRGARRLLISASVSAPRMHFIETTRENPAAPPMFCMLLRKHVQGAKIVSITQPGLERIAVIELDGYDEMGVLAKKYLYCELMGKFSNIILADAEGRILDSLRRIEGDVVTGKRQVLPGLFYRLPPAQEGKLDLTQISSTGLIAAIEQAEGENLDKWLLSHFFGISPLICRELCYRATGDVSKSIALLTDAERATLLQVLNDFIAYVNNAQFRPYLLLRKNDETPFDFTVLPITQYESLMTTSIEPSFSTLLGTFYDKKTHIERMRRRAQDMLRTVTTARDRLARKLAAQKQELENTKNRDEYKQLGDLVTANFYQLERGARSAKVINYFSEDCSEIEIPLDARLSPQQNAQRYFKLYNKAKTAEEILTHQVKEGERDLIYLESVLEAVDEAECEQDLAQLREELIQTGYLSAKNKGKKNMRQKPVNASPYHYRTSDGFDVFAGKNNLQNDLLTLKTAYKSDVWFHTQKIHGSHVILVTDGKEPSNEAMTEAAQIAAYHSKARGSAMVPVDYSEVRNIKKPAGAKPGMVIYHVYKTAFVTPVEDSVEKLRVK